MTLQNVNGGLDSEPIMMTVAEAAELLGVSEWLVLKEIQQGRLPHKRLGRRILIHKGLFNSWITQVQTD